MTPGYGPELYIQPQQDDIVGKPNFQLLEGKHVNKHNRIDL